MKYLFVHQRYFAIYGHDNMKKIKQHKIGNSKVKE